MIRLKELREGRLLTQRDLAAKSGVALSSIVRIEHDEVVPNFTTLHKLAAALDVEATALVADMAAYHEARKRQRKPTDTNLDGPVLRPPSAAVPAGKEVR